MKFPLSAHRNIDRRNVFSLARQPPCRPTPYNLTHYITSLFFFRPQYIALSDKPLSSPVSMSNKITFTVGLSKSKKIYEFSVFYILYAWNWALPAKYPVL
jgi:hypothetical protein